MRATVAASARAEPVAQAARPPVQSPFAAERPLSAPPLATPVSLQPAAPASPAGRADLAHDFARMSVVDRPASGVVDMEEGAGPEDETLLSDQDDAGAPGGAPPAAPAGGGPAAPPPAPPPAPLAVTVPADIRAPSTPAAMAQNRIPPRIDTAVAVTMTGWSSPMPPVTLSIEGGGGGNGTATINGAATADLTGGGGTVQLRGKDQTDAAAKAGNLKLVAKQGTTRLAASNGFSVSSIPQNWSVTFVELITGTRRGIRVNNNWESDSTDVTDLDKAERSEQVQYGAGSGSLAGVTGVNSGYRAANSPPLVDSHGIGVGALTGPGNLVAEQTFIFKDNRVGAADIPATKSGYRLTRDVTEPTPGSLQITTSKVGTATTANGYASAAGAGSVTKTQAV